MSVGDIVNVRNLTASGGNYIYQPSAGIEIMVTKIGGTLIAGSSPDACFNIGAALYNGSIASEFAIANNNPEHWTNLKIFINNTNYLRITNYAGSNQMISIQGIQTK